MRKPIIATLAVLAPFLASGCSGDPQPKDEPGNNSTISTPKDLQRAQAEVLQHLQKFETHDLDKMDDAATKLEEMAASEHGLVSAEIQDQIKKYRNPATADSAIERLRWISHFARTLLLLEGYEKDNWIRCRDAMLRQGPEAVVRFAGVLIVKFPDNQDWCGRMLMDLCVARGSLVEDAILEALAFRSDQSGALPMRLLDDTGLRGLCGVLLGLPKPPEAKIRNSALKGPDTTRRAWAARLKDLKSNERTVPWASAILGEILAADTDWQVRSTAADSLGESGDPEKSLPALAIALKDRDHWVRRNTCISFSRFGARARGYVSDILRMLVGLQTEEFEFEEEGKIVRHPLAGNPKRELLNAGTEALRKLTGKPFQDVEVFEAWFAELSADDRAPFEARK